jgi:hypothetical protein
LRYIYGCPQTSNLARDATWILGRSEAIIWGASDVECTLLVTWFWFFGHATYLFLIEALFPLPFLVWNLPLASRRRLLGGTSTLVSSSTAAAATRLWSTYFRRVSHNCPFFLYKVGFSSSTVGVYLVTYGPQMVSQDATKCVAWRGRTRTKSAAQSVSCAAACCLSR